MIRMAALPPKTQNRWGPAPQTPRGISEKKEAKAKGARHDSGCAI